MNTNNTIEKSSCIKTTAVFFFFLKKRYILNISWDDTKKKACIIMTYPSTADEYIIDQTTMLCRNNAVMLGYGSISIVNLFCGLDLKKPETDRMNYSVLAEECSKADIVIVAYGRGTGHEEEKTRLLESLNPYHEKLYTIVDSLGNTFSHPLSPKARNWKIKKL